MLILTPLLRKGGLVTDLFLPFKTPLDHKFNGVLDGLHQFPPESILDYGFKFGLWVDLTKTSRFYDKTSVESRGIEYLKLECEGHSEAPNEETVAEFVSKVQKVTDADSDAKIAVHCTHGYNRTGFLICSFLIEDYGFATEAAIDEFSRSRPPGIYKQGYLDELCKRYGAEHIPVAPPLPEWDNDQEEDEEEPPSTSISSVAATATSSGAEDTEKPLAQPKNKRPRREVEKQNALFCKGIETVEQVTDKTNLAKVRTKVQEMCEWNCGGFPGRNIQSLLIVIFKAQTHSEA